MTIIIKYNPRSLLGMRKAACVSVFVCVCVCVSVGVCVCVLLLLMVVVSAGLGVFFAGVRFVFPFKQNITFTGKLID